MNHILEVIPMKSKAYRAVEVKHVNWQRLIEGRDGQDVMVGLDMGKERVLCGLRWGAHDFERPWRVHNPSEARLLAEGLAWLGQGRRMVVAMEPTGTYGDVLRQALAQAGVNVHRVSPKMAADFAEIFDGVPSQHDGKDAAVVAELAALGRCWPWPWHEPTEQEQELAYWVDDLDGQRRHMMMWFGRLEALVSRHWPEATRLVQMRSATLLKCLARYGGPGQLAADPQALAQVRKWGRAFLSPAKAEALVASAAATAGVKQGRWDEERVRRCATEILQFKQKTRQAAERLRALAKGNVVLEAQAEAVGTVTACVLWVHLGDPRDYHCGAAYRKAMGLNLAERSSGKYEGQLKISKRGSAVVRRWLYLAALRHVRQEPTKSWYARQKKERRGEGKPALIGVMRKLALALYQVGGRGEKFRVHELFGS
jgi:transposase